MLSFAAFYEEVHPRLITSLAALCGDVDLAAEAADEAAVKAIERWERVAPMANPQGWLFRVAVHERRRQRRRSLEQRLLRSSAPSFGLVPGPAGEIWTLVAGLGDRQREAIVLRHIAQLSEPRSPRRWA
jgi:DNA-directed RNA polymerase specialized sigma24 family protein